MAVRLLKAERDRVLATNGGTAVREGHLTMDSPHCLQSGPSDRQKKPTGERG